MNTTLADAYVLAGGVKGEAEEYEHVDIVLCPPLVWLGLLAEHVISPKHQHNLFLGAQNMHHNVNGAFTGEVSPAMVSEIAQYVILGHSERTHLFKENVQFIAQKVRAAFDYGISPILCIGEDEKSQSSMKQVVYRLDHLITELSESEIARLTVAYEPVWAIGTGNAATADYAQEVAGLLRQRLSNQTRILYGGSVSKENAKEFLTQADIDGLLIGGASLKLRDFLTICKYADDIAIQKATGKAYETEDLNPSIV